MFKVSIRVLMIGILIGCCGACSTVRSNLFSSDGTSSEKVKKHLKGTPTTLPVASHFKLIVNETRFLNKSNGEVLKVARNQGGTSEVLRQRDLSYEIIYKAEVFTVDLKRPAAGLIDYKILYRTEKVETNEHQELASIATASYDETIVRATDLLSSLMRVAKVRPLGASTADPVVPPVAPEEYDAVTSTIACEIFDLYDPMLNDRLRTFVGSYFDNDLCRGPCPTGQRTTGQNCITR